MADWDPAHLVHYVDRKQNTNAELARYRSMYQTFLTECKSDQEGALLSTDNMTKVSLLANCLDYAACQIGAADEVLGKIMREVATVAAHDTRAPEEARKIKVPLIAFLNGEEEEPHMRGVWLAHEMGVKIDQGTITDDEMGWLRDGFAALYSS